MLERFRLQTSSSQLRRLREARRHVQETRKMLNDLEFELKLIAWIKTIISIQHKAKAPQRELQARKKICVNMAERLRYVYKFYALSSINLRVISIIFISRIVYVLQNSLARRVSTLFDLCSYIVEQRDDDCARLTSKHTNSISKCGSVYSWNHFDDFKLSWRPWQWNKRLETCCV